MVTEEGFAAAVKELRDMGAKRVFLKTGAYRPVDLARAVKYASDNRIDLLTVDGAGGGTGMSPWRMMNEWGVPTVELCSLTYEYVDYLAKQGKYVPDVAFAGGFTLEDQMFKGFALGAPYVKAIGMARGSLARRHGRKDGGQPGHGGRPSRLHREVRNHHGRGLLTGVHLRDSYGKDFEKLHPGRHRRVHLLPEAGPGASPADVRRQEVRARVHHRDDIASLTREAAEVSGIPMVTEARPRVGLGDNKGLAEPQGKYVVEPATSWQAPLPVVPGMSDSVDCRLLVAPPTGGLSV